MQPELTGLSGIRACSYLAIFLVLWPLQILGAMLPTVLTPLEASKSVKRLPAYIGFGYSGLAFHGNKLYASCNVGLLEITNGVVSKDYVWNKSDSVVEGPWSDSANGRLWVWLPGNDYLANFDGKTWQTVPMPKPKSGYVTRGDVLEGYRGVSGTNSFWMTGGGNAWPWNDVQKKWGDPIDLPKFTSGNRRGTLQRLFLVGDTPFVVARYEPGWAILGRARDGKLVGDTFHHFNKNWQQILHNSNKSFFTEQAVAIGERGFIRTVDGEILAVDPSGVSEFKSPGFCEALAVTSARTLLASFRDAGVFEYTKDWVLRIRAPYPASKGENRVHLAESDGRIALAIAPVPSLENGRTVYASASGTWFFNGKDSMQVQFSIAPTKK